MPILPRGRAVPGGKAWVPRVPGVAEITGRGSGMLSLLMCRPPREWNAGTRQPGTRLNHWARGCAFEDSQGPPLTLRCLVLQQPVDGLFSCLSYPFHFLRIPVAGSSAGLPYVAVSDTETPPLARNLGVSAVRPGVGGDAELGVGGWVLIREECNSLPNCSSAGWGEKPTT